MKKEKKKFGETGLGKFLKEKGPGLLATVGDAILPGNILSSLIQVDPDMTPEDKAEAMRLLQQYELEVFRAENEDRANARSREVELAKAGKTDWLMYASGLTALGSFLVVVFAVIFIPSTKDNPLFIHLMGMVEGTAITVYIYYFGTSRSSNEKTKLLSNINTNNGKRTDDSAAQ